VDRATDVGGGPAGARASTYDDCRPSGHPAWNVNGDFYVDFGQCTVHLYVGWPDEEYIKVVTGLQMADVNDPSTWTDDPLPQ